MSKHNERKSDQQPKFMVRLTDEIKSQVKASASRNRRSMNSEILSLIEDGYKYRGAEACHE